MEKLQTLEELRTRREVEEYFKQLGKEITEEELDALKQSYEQAQESNGALTMQQLDDVAGGINYFDLFILFDRERYTQLPNTGETCNRFEFAGHNIFVYCSQTGLGYDSYYTALHTNMKYKNRDISLMVSAEEFNKLLIERFPNEIHRAEFYRQLSDYGVDKLLRYRTDIYFIKRFEDRQKEGFESAVGNDFREHLKSKIGQGDYFTSFEHVFEEFYAKNGDIADFLSSSKKIHEDLEEIYNSVISDITKSFIVREIVYTNGFVPVQIEEKFHMFYRSDDFEKKLSFCMSLISRLGKNDIIRNYNEYLQLGFYPDLSINPNGLPAKRQKI